MIERVTPKQIIASVALRHGLTADDLKGRHRAYRISRARQEAMWTLRRHTKLSTTQIGRMLGGRDHTTAIWGIRQHQERLDAEAAA